jgi:predicted DNA-binding ribbon-helix-helix protein
MRTTVRIDDELLRDLKQRAQRDKMSVTDLINQTIRRGLELPARADRSRRFRQKTHNLGPPLVDITKALALAAQLEDEEILKKLAQRK